MLSKSMGDLQIQLKKLLTLPVLGFLILFTSVSIGAQNISESYFLKPVAKTFPIASTFGLKTHPVLKTEREHFGIDYKVPIGTPVLASKSGTITHLGKKGSYGETIIIDHGNGFKSLYSNLSEFTSSLKVGSEVIQGEEIARSGNSGLTVDAHLHFAIMKKGTFVDPEPLLLKFED